MVRHNLRLIIALLTLLILSGLPVAAQAGNPAAQKKPSAKAAPAATLKPGAAEQQDQAAADLRAIRKPPLPEFHPQEPRRIQLENGMVVFLQEDHELPLINGTAYIYGGSKSEPANKIGLVSIYGSAWRTGGTKTQTGDQLDDVLETTAPGGPQRPDVDNK